jgi:hypothetical protein
MENGKLEIGLWSLVFGLWSLILFNYQLSTINYQLIFRFPFSIFHSI